MKPLTKKILIALGIAILVAVIVWYFFLRSDDQEVIDAATATTTPKTSIVTKLASKVGLKYNYTPVTVFDNLHPIKQFMKGKEVAQLQIELGLKPDGLWGPETQKVFLAKKYPVPDQEGQIYSILTKSLYDKLGLSKYSVDDVIIP